MLNPFKISGAVAGIVVGLTLALGGSHAFADTAVPTTPAPPPAAATPISPAAPAGKPAPAPIAPPSAAPALKAAPYPDVPAKHPAAGAVKSLKDKKVMAAKADGKFHGADYVTRYELAVILDKFIAYNEDAHKPIKITSVPGPYVLSAPANHWAYAAQVHLVSAGFLPKDSPILAKPGTANVSKDELTAALSAVMIRLSDRSLPVTTHDDEPAPPKAPTN